MWKWKRRHLDHHTLHFHVAVDGRYLSRGEVFGLWRHEPTFVDSFVAALAATPWEAFRWETPPVVTADLDQPFECIVCDSRDLEGAPDPSPFAEHFRVAGKRKVVEFENLGGDAKLVVPCPPDDALIDHSAFSHLANFVRGAPRDQQRALWHRVGRAMNRRTGDVPVWLSTAGSGVAWLHVRLDDRPKYYSHSPYRHFRPEPGN